MEELLSTLTEAIVKQKERLDDIQSVLDLLQDETKSNQDEIIKVRDTLTKQIEDIIVQTQKLIDKAISSIDIEVPKVDYLRIETSIKAKINRLLTEKDKDIAELRAELKDFVIENLSRFKPRDGKDADNELIIKEIKRFIADNASDFKGKNGTNGKDGTDGIDGVGIDDIKKDKDNLVITLTNGTVKRFALPKQTIKYMGGGGGSSGIDLTSLKEVTSLQNSDYVIIMRDNELMKISALNASSYFGSEVIDNTLMTESGAYITTEDNIYLNFEEI